jgi:hypothetical protein
LAIFHCSLRVFSRSEGHSAVAAAAYRAGAVLRDEQRGLTHRYRNRKGVVASFILTPPYAPESTRDRLALWNAVEAAESRKNSRVAREIILALPHELEAPERQRLAHDMALWLVERYRVAVDANLHSPVAGDGSDPRNHHAHLLFTTREITKDGLGKKTRILDDKEHGPQEVELIRLIWETLVNDALEQAGRPEAKIDRQSLEDQGLDRIPQIHIGAEAKAAKKKSDKQDDKSEDDRAEEDKDKKRDEDDEDGEQGKGESGRQGDGSGGGYIPPARKEQEQRKETKSRDVDYSGIDRGITRSELVDEIKRVNAERRKWPDAPLATQIKTIEKEMTTLDRKVRRFETLQAKISLPAIVKNAIAAVVTFAKEMILPRSKNREALTLSEQEQQARLERQTSRYGRPYKTGIQQQLREMKTRLALLEETHERHNKYKSLTHSVDKNLIKLPFIKFTSAALLVTAADLKLPTAAATKAELPGESQPKVTANKEASRTDVPIAKKAPVSLAKITDSKPATQLSVEAESWLYPATKESRALQDRINQAMAHNMMQTGASAQPQAKQPQPEAGPVPPNNAFNSMGRKARADEPFNRQRGYNAHKANPEPAGRSKSDNPSGAFNTRAGSNSGSQQRTWTDFAQANRKAESAASKESPRTEPKAKAKASAERAQQGPSASAAFNHAAGAANKRRPPQQPESKPS